MEKVLNTAPFLVGGEYGLSAEMVATAHRPRAKGPAGMTAIRTRRIHRVRRVAVFGLAGLSTAFTASACGESTECVEFSDALEPGTSNPVGVTVAEVVDSATLEGTRELVWSGAVADPGDTMVHWSITPELDSARFINSRRNARDREHEGVCEDRLEIDATLAISTDDGVLDEPSFPITLIVRARGPNWPLLV